MPGEALKSHFAATTLGVVLTVASGRRSPEQLEHNPLLMKEFTEWMELQKLQKLKKTTNSKSNKNVRGAWSPGKLR